jgi:hypothetical protein
MSTMAASKLRQLVPGLAVNSVISPCSACIRMRVTCRSMAMGVGRNNARQAGKSINAVVAHGGAVGALSGRDRVDGGPKPAHRGTTTHAHAPLHRTRCRGRARGRTRPCVGSRCPSPRCRRGCSPAAQCTQTRTRPKRRTSKQLPNSPTGNTLNNHTHRQHTHSHTARTQPINHTHPTHNLTKRSQTTPCDDTTKLCPYGYAVHTKAKGGNSKGARAQLTVG